MIDDEGNETRKREDVGGSDFRPFAVRYEEAALRSSMYRLERWRLAWADRLQDRRSEKQLKRKKYHRDGEAMNDGWEPNRSVR